MQGIGVELVELTSAEEDSLALLGTQLDAFVTIDIYGSAERAVPICKIGSSDFYFAVSRNRPELLVELNAAMNRIQDENKYYNQQLHEIYLILLFHKNKTIFPARIAPDFVIGLGNTQSIPCARCLV